MSGPNAALAPAWKLVPVTVPVALAICAPELGDTPEIVGTIGTLSVALAAVPSAKVAVADKVEPDEISELYSEATSTNTLPTATSKVTAPLPAFRSAPSRLAAAPSAQLG